MVCLRLIPQFEGVSSIQDTTAQFRYTLFLMYACASQRFINIFIPGYLGGSILVFGVPALQVSKA